MNKEVYMCFTGYNKTFDKVKHYHLLRFRKEKTIHNRNIRIIRLYYNHKVNIQRDQNMYVQRNEDRQRYEAGVRLQLIEAIVDFW